MEKVTSHEEIRLLPVREAAARLAVCRRTLERLVAAGKFPPFVKVGRASRVFESDVSAFLAQLRTGRRAAP
jgi:excisionase family DNA binding protein